MADFPSAGLELVKHFNLDGIFLEKQEVVTHDVSQQPELDQQQQQQEGVQQQRHGRHKLTQKQQQQQQQQQQEGADGASPSSARHASSRASSSRKHKQQQQQQQGAMPPMRYSQPRPHPLNLKPRHVKTHYMVPTSDGWKLHLIRTQVQNTQPSHHHPVILCPGLGSSGAYSFDLSPNVSLADYLAGKGWDVWTCELRGELAVMLVVINMLLLCGAYSFDLNPNVSLADYLAGKGWDVWTCELRGNGMSDKPSLFGGRSRWWAIDDHVEKDVPAILRFVLKETHTRQAHFLGHSMGGMILCGVMARVDTTTAKIRSCIAVGSGLFLEESWWRLFERFKPLSRTLWTVPSGTMLRAYSRLMFGPWRIPYIDALYFWPSNVDPHVGRAMMRRNFSNISVGVIEQMVTAFGPQGLLSADKRVVYADPGRLAKVTAPALFLVGDRDRMCPAEGCRKTWQMFGSPDKRFVCLGPAAGFSDHYGHFDILMGKRVEKEVFPLIHGFLLQHDSPRPRL
ncbi:hypothetical protein OEZ85_011317 [Tetradesmus obliquus]|uniref:Serine aminopeptidase S33 domain-containing protein n=1 Tax=Tetradesmus obliquus TaxID=3088 RepID=A0ABY8TPY9_TETOB|nr:hypothetical protein OEZ85_011317 [Tetradesmus obliquus]